MKYFIVFCVFVLCSCNNTTTGPAAEKDSTVVIAAPVVSETRTAVKSAPAAEYSEKIKDELNDWKFAVAVYETNRTFHYTVRVQAKEVRVTDSVNIPDLGIEPKVEIRKGKQPLTCLIGFLDKKNVFHEYREVSFINDRLRIKTTHTYSVGSYRTKVSTD